MEVLRSLAISTASSFRFGSHFLALFFRGITTNAILLIFYGEALNREEFSTHLIIGMTTCMSPDPSL